MLRNFRSVPPEKRKCDKMERFNKIRAALASRGLDAALVTSESNRFYAAGFPSSDGMALVTGDGAWFLTDSRYIEAAENAIRDAAVIPVGNGRSYSDIINQILTAHKIRTVGFEDEYMSYREYKKYSDKLQGELIPAQELFNGLRAVKDETELKIMREAQRIAEKSFNDVLGIISTDITEKEFAAELLYRFLKNGAEDKGFDTIAVSGKKSSMPHGVPGDNKIEKGFFTVDFGVKYKGYCSDTTRTVCIGKPTDEMRDVYNTVLEAQLAGISAAKAGVSGKAIDGAARDVIASKGYGDYFSHSFGHSLGIDIHEPPNASPGDDKPIPAGAVISAEPGIYIPGKFGVRIEDALFIKEGGNEDITALPKELLII